MAANRRVTDPAALRAMSHPLRLRLYYALTLAGSATATRLAEGLDESVSLVSYHLRQLARHGYVETDPEPPGVGDGRERWWRPSSIGFSWSPSDFGEDPEAAAAVAQAERLMDAHRAAYQQAWRDSRAGWSAEWRDAAISSDNPLLRMTPAELREFQTEFLDLMARWTRRQQEEPGHDSGEHVMILLQAFPFRP